MPVNHFQERLLKDLRASAPKTAVLAVLLLVGLYFWVPPLLSAFSGNSASTAAPAAAAVVSSPGQSAASSVVDPVMATGSATKSTRNNECVAIADLLKECPALQPAAPSEMPLKPFTLDIEQFPIPVLVSDENEELPKSVTVVEEGKRVDCLDGLVLKSTIVGAKQRAAWINNRLFREGQMVPWNQKQLRLSLVSPKAVTLSDGSNEWRLTLNDTISEFDGETIPSKNSEAKPQ